MKLIYQLWWETMLSILARYFLKILDVGNFPWYVRYDQKTYLNMVKHTSKTPMFFKSLDIRPTECCEFALQILNVGFISPGPRESRWGRLQQQESPLALTFWREQQECFLGISLWDLYLGLKVFIYSLESHQKRQSIFSESFFRLCNINWNQTKSLFTFCTAHYFGIATLKFCLFISFLLWFLFLLWRLANLE